MNAITAASRVLPLLPVGVADRRLAAAVFRHQGAPTKARARLRGGAQFVVDTAQWPEAQALALRRYDVSTVAFVLEHLPPTGTMFDVGAHVGLISFQALAARPRARIHAFEPNPLVARRYEENNALNGGAAQLSQVGVSDRAKTLRYDTSTYAIAADGDAEIPVITLDSYIADRAVTSIHVLKIDVEGHELAVLEGAHSALRDGRIGAVTLEAMEEHGDTTGARALLLSAGYREVTMPDPRPAWLARRRAWRPENCAFVRR